MSYSTPFTKSDLTKEGNTKTNSTVSEPSFRYKFLKNFELIEDFHFCISSSQNERHVLIQTPSEKLKLDDLNGAKFDLDEKKLGFKNFNSKFSKVSFPNDLNYEFIGENMESNHLITFFSNEDDDSIQSSNVCMSLSCIPTLNMEEGEERNGKLRKKEKHVNGDEEGEEGEEGEGEDDDNDNKRSSHKKKMKKKHGNENSKQKKPKLNASGKKKK